ncbi:c-type cytochrome biogenesis protein CcmI [Phenylobacterium aquaticum]|uniref:c-type cytochrome biogenesis protein CcmI n=2 Tax=Phenylobacterium aquaticum TaxID=1763816 RepID=UPI0026ED46D8|nr:c-type cytochrome biogenesis protein CcmI [Phenylobacterium aquaticum]
MIALWVAAGVLAAATAGLVLHRAARAAANVGTTDPTLDVYRRQLTEIDDLADRGLIGEAERGAARAEASRRLLTAADATAQPWSHDAGERRPVLIAAGLAPVLALGLYLWVGSPGLPDDSFKHRLSQWRAADLQSLPPAALAAVMRQVATERPKDPDAWRYLALAESAAENTSASGRALRHAITLAPGRADLWELLGQSLVVEGGGAPSPEADNAFREALKRDPTSIAARFHLARSRVMSGDKAGGLAAWTALLADLPANDPRRPALQQAIVEARSETPAVAAAPPGGQIDMIRGMVAGLAERLKTQPDDPEGWVRLVRSYAVLGESAKRDATLAQARKRFAGQAAIQAELDAAAKTEPMK